MVIMNINQHIEAAIASLKAYNAIQDEWTANAKRNGYAAAFRDRPQMADHLLVELLGEIVHFDENPTETLAELLFQEEMEEEREREIMPRLSLVSDEEWDFAASRGLQS